MAATAIPVDTIPSIDPATGEILAQFEKTQPSDLSQIFSRARAAQARWSAVPVEKRCAQLRVLRDRMMASREALADAVVAESGKPRVEALFADIFVALDTAQYLSKYGARLL
ncbi:MAG: aldehyde dehydrogenase family protein, partial [Candidatus Acidiferrum sp.]